MDIIETPALIVESGDEGVLLLRLNRAEKRNALATPLLRELEKSLAEAATDDAIRCVVVTGSDKVFAAGADLTEIGAKDVAGALADPRPGIWSGIRFFPKPWLAAVEGWCLGAGNELLMCCDLAIAGRVRVSVNRKRISASCPALAEPQLCPDLSAAPRQ